MMFSVELPWCYFCAEIQVLRMTWNSTEIYFGIYKKYLRKEPDQGGHSLSTRVWGTPPLWAHPLPRGPPVAPPTPYIHFRGEKIREKELSHFMIRSRCQALISLGRADLESVRGSGEGRSSPSSSSTFLHHQFHDAHRRAWVIPS